PLDPQTVLLVASRENIRRNPRENGQNQKQPRKEKGGLHGRRMYRRFDAWQETSRTKPLNFPSSIRLPRVAHPIMQTPRPSLPKLDARRRHPETAPAFRNRHFLPAKSLLQFRLTRLQFGPASD